MTPAYALLQAAAVAFAAPTAELRDAQARFESVRRMHLAVEHSGPGRCEARIGRFCYWYDSAPPPPERPEAPRTVHARERLLDELERAAARWPADPWIAGQRVRYLVDAGRADSAARLRCEAEPWWCAALRGLAFHVAGQTASADSAHSAALAAMPDSVRCEWLDLADAFEDPVARELARAPCAERERLIGVALRLGQPLWMTPGNDLRAELFSRQAMAVVLAGSATPHRTRWGSDMRELLLRYGWADRYTRSPPRGADMHGWSILGHDREPHWNVMPRLASLASPWITPDAWDLRGYGARMRYSPRHVGALLELPHQLVRIPRGDSMRVAVAFRLPDAALRADTTDAALSVLHRGALSTAAAPRGFATVVVAADTVVVSAEVRGRGSRRAARARYSVSPLPCRAAGLCVSDLLLFDAMDGVSLEEALARARHSAVSAAEPLGIWWHLRGVPGPLALTLTVQPLPSAIRRAAQAVRLTGSAASTRLRWQAPLRADTASMQVTVRLPPGARGRYRVSLTAQRGEAQPVTSSRDVVVTP